MLIINLILLVIPIFVLSVFFYRRGLLEIFLPYAFLYTINCACFSFLILYFSNIKSGYLGRWLLFYSVSILFGFIVLKIFNRLKCDHEKLKLTKIDGVIMITALSIIIISFGFWHYISSSSTCMYYIWLDVCRYWRDTGLIFPVMPDSNPSNSFLVGLTYNPTILSVLQLLTANIEQHNYFHAWGILTGIFHAFLFVTLVASSSFLFKNRIIGAITFFLFFLGEWGGANLLGINMFIGSHESATFYGAALLFLSWLLFIKRKNVCFISLFIWCSLGFFSIRPYLAAFIGSFCLIIFILMLRGNKIDLKERILNKESFISLVLGLFLGFIPFIWQIHMHIKYKSLVVYSHNVMFGSFSDYFIHGSSLSERLHTFIENAVMFIPVYIRNYMQPVNQSAIYTLMPLAVFILLLISLMAWYFRNIQMKCQYQTWIHQLFIVLFFFVIISLIINVDHWKTVAPWSIILYFLAASFLIFVFYNDKWSYIFSQVLCIFLIGYFAVGGIYYNTIWPHYSEYKMVKQRDDRYRNEIKKLSAKIDDNIMVVRVEPGADANFEVPNKYYWNLRFLWNDVDLIMNKLEWNPTKVAYELRKNNIRWIYQPLNWSMDNHAGRQTVLQLKAMLDEGKDLYIPVINDKSGRTEIVFYEIILPTEKFVMKVVQ